MKVIINPGGKTATDKDDGKVYNIKGLLVKNARGRDKLYPIGTEMCNANVFKNLYCDAFPVEDDENILL